MTDDRVEKKIKIFRYKFNKDIIDMLTYFAKLHKYDNRVDYKEAWEIWYKENSDTLQREANRIISLGYDGNVEDKMYKAARYYFRKVEDTTEESSPVDAVKVSKRQYIHLSREILDAMDNHIKNNIDNENYKPATGYDDFCKNNMISLAVEIKNLSTLMNKNYISSKIKKTYKNRYFQLII